MWARNTCGDEEVMMLEKKNITVGNVEKKENLNLKLLNRSRGRCAIVPPKTKAWKRQR